MADPRDIERTKASLKKLISSLSIGRIVCIDDQYAVQSVDELLPVLMELSQLDLEETFRGQEFQFAEDKSIRRQTIRGLFSNAPAEVKRRTTERFAPPSAARDAGAAAVLSQVLEEGSFLTLSPSEWEQRKDEILAAEPDQRTLLLFDQDLTRDTQVNTSGIALIQNALANDASGRLMCGLLTHTATLANYQDKWQEHAQRTGIDKERFLVVPKEALDSDLQGFVRMLKLVALAPDCQKLRKQVSVLFAAAAENAMQKMDGLSPFDLEHLVFKISHEEGLWEPDTLFRLFGIYHRSCIRGPAHESPELRSVVERIRSVSQVPVTVEDGDEHCSRTGAELQQLELYEPGTYINQLHLPLEVGDIFRKTDGGSTKHFILLAQPCDLMVRANGKRGVEEILLAEIVAGGDERDYSEAIHYFGDDPKEKHWVLLKRTHMVSSLALDLCVFSEQGVSAMAIPCDCPRGLCTSWQARFIEVQKQVAGLFRKYCGFGRTLNAANQALLGQMRAATAAEFPPRSGNTDVFRGTVTLAPERNALAFNCQRVKRLERSRALALAVAYANCLTRPGFQRDLGQPLTRMGLVGRPAPGATAPLPSPAESERAGVAASPPAAVQPLLDSLPSAPASDAVTPARADCHPA